MGEDWIYKEEAGELEQESIDLEIITWKLTGLGSMTTGVDSAGVESRPFSFAGATWILKLLICGQETYNSQRYVDLVIERQHSEIEVHEISCKVFCKNVYDTECKPITENFSFRLNHTRMNILKITQLSDKSKLLTHDVAVNDSFTLVCEIQNKKSVNKIKSIEKTSGFGFDTPCSDISTGVSFAAQASTAPDSSGFTFSTATPLTTTGFICDTPLFSSAVSAGLNFDTTATTSVSTGFAFSKETSTTTSTLTSGTSVTAAVSGFSFAAPRNTQSTGLTFGTPTTSISTGFTLGQETSTTTSSLTSKTSIPATISGFSFAAPRNTQSTGLTFGTPTSVSTGFTLGQETPTTTNGLIFGTSTPATTSGFSFGTTRKTQSTGRTFGKTASTNTGFKFGTTTSTTGFSFGTNIPATTTTAVASFGSFSFAAASTSIALKTRVVSVHEEKVLRDLKELFLKQEDCDAIIRVKGKEFPAHRTILKARSPVFNTTFRNDMQEKTSGIVDIEDCDPASFSDFLFFLYCGNTENLSIKNVFSVFTTADKYAVLDLRSECIEFMKKNLTVDSFCDTIALALKHSESGLIKSCADFFAKNLKKIIVTVKWQSFITENPIQCNELMIKAFSADNN